MNQAQATLFVEDLLNHLVVKADIESLDRFYSNDVIGHYRDIDFNFDDIKNRASFLKTVCKARNHILHEVIKADEKIIFRDRQVMTHRLTNAVISSEVTGVYTIKNGKVSELWLMTDKIFDYQESPESGLQKTALSVDEANFQQFQNMVSTEQYLIHGKLQTVDLTDREIDVLYFTLQGFTAKQIGKNLGISNRTVESYIDSLKNKFNVNNKSDLRQLIAPGGYWV